LESHFHRFLFPFLLLLALVLAADFVLLPLADFADFLADFGSTDLLADGM